MIFPRCARRFLALVALVAVVVVASSCDTTPQVRESAPVQTTLNIIKVDDSVAATATSSVILPAFETEAERLQKTDAADDFRNTNRQWFAQTVAPTAERYRPFGEWEEMSAVWTTYTNGMPSVKPVRRMFAEQTINFVRHSNPKVKAYVIVSGQNTANDMTKALDEFGATAEEKKNVIFVQMENQTIWHIDYGPFPLIDRKTDELAFVDYMYYPNRQIDDSIPTRIGHEVYKDVTTFRMPFPFEGGNIQADGDGMCLTSERALKNTGYSALKARNLLKKYNGCKETIIVKDISDDGTGHIDMFFKWIAPDHVMFGKYENEITLDYDGDGKEETLPMPGKVSAAYVKTFELNQKRMDDNAALFAALKSPVTGKNFKVSRLSMMTALRDQYGHLPRTFINSTFTNKVNVYPSYSDNSCRDPKGATCMKNADCKAEQYCAAGKCTNFSKNKNGQVTLGTPRGCDALMGCAQGQECVPDPMKIALKKQVQKQWEAAMPETKHVGLVADRIALWSGAIHCITRTIPNKPFKKAVHDGLCLAGKCGCVDDGYTGKCDADANCWGPKFLCNCQRCVGKCAGSDKKCTDDADCSTDNKTIVDGSCNIDPNQTCKGESGAGAGSCGSLAWEGWCDGQTLKYCSSGKAKQIKCPACCGWDNDEGSYNCLAKTACSTGCVAECEKEGEVGCSIQNSHSWVCEKKDGCLRRKYTYCDGGKTCGNAGTCVAAGGTAPKCPDDWPPGSSSGGDADAGSSDDGASTSGGGSADGQAGIDGGSSSSSGGATSSGGGDDSGCSATPKRTSTGNQGWLLTLLFALGAVWMRRRRLAAASARGA